VRDEGSLAALPAARNRSGFYPHICKVAFSVITAPRPSYAKFNPENLQISYISPQAENSAKISKNLAHARNIRLTGHLDFARSRKSQYKSCKFRSKWLSQPQLELPRSSG
jgi:hypothetical protein